MEDPRLLQIQALVEPVLAERGLELVELTCRPQGRQLHVRVLVDQVGGVSIQRCAQVNQAISLTLEAANLFEDSYTVEVSSPGLDRPLASKRDFERAIGEDLQVQLQAEPGRPGECRGMLLAVRPEAIVVKTDSGNVTIPLTQIRSAKKALRW